MPDSTTPAPSDLLTITEAAGILRAPVATLRYWRHLGTGPESFRLGRRVLYRRDDLDAWVDAQHDRVSRSAAGRRAPGDEAGSRGVAPDPDGRQTTRSA